VLKTNNKTSLSLPVATSKTRNASKDSHRPFAIRLPIALFPGAFLVPYQFICVHPCPSVVPFILLRLRVLRASVVKFLSEMLVGLAALDPPYELFFISPPPHSADVAKFYCSQTTPNA
jgi:hypothetical protein